MDPAAIFVLIAGFLVVVVFMTALGWERYRPRARPQIALPTTEVFIDPTTHQRTRVWIDPASGVREYREELDTTATPLPPLQRPGLHLPPDPGAQPPRQLPPPQS